MEINKLSTDLNREAWMTCLKAVAKFPQASGGSYIIADEIMKSFYGEGNLTPLLMAHVKPDPNECQRKVNEIHDLFGINRKVTSSEAVSFVLSFALDSLDDIRDATFDVSDKLCGETPDEIKGNITLTSFKRSDTVSDSINFKLINELEIFLGQNHDVCDLVRDKIRTEANFYRSRSRDQLNYISKHHHS